ncbi:MAG: alpha/beta hydrolase [Advenella sp.]
MDKFIEIPVKPGGFMESQSGIQRRNPKIFCRLVTPAQKTTTVFVLVHPTSNFHSHYLIEPLISRGVAVCLVNTRYVANDTMLFMERAIQDLGAGIRHLRNLGYERIVLIGNSGGGSMAALYQEQAEKLSISTTPDGLPINLEQSDLPPVDALAMVCAHPGRAEQLLFKIDPSVLDERFPELINPALSMYNPKNGPAFAADWLALYRQAQKKRLDHITSWVLARLKLLEQTVPIEIADEPFIIHRTQADPRLLDLSLDKNDRKQGSIQGQASLTNQAANGLARFCTLRSFLSQWSPTHTRANGPQCLANTSVPVMVVEHTADQTVFPSQIEAWMNSAGIRGTHYALKEAPHYLDDKPELLNELADLLVNWR